MLRSLASFFFVVGLAYSLLPVPTLASENFDVKPSAEYLEEGPTRVYHALVIDEYLLSLSLQVVDLVKPRRDTLVDDMHLPVLITESSFFCGSRVLLAEWGGLDA